tara:strand:- start:71 stop:673 length:603 start_codon:yes stop_codon:yes gene_type:complete
MHSSEFWVIDGNHSQPTLINDTTGRYRQERQRTNALRYVESKRNCIDIGSHVGLWTRELASKFEQVYCFEPNPVFIECFKKNITETNVQLFQYGLSNNEHTASMKETNSTMMNDAPGSIQCRTLDSFNLNNIDFIKIDVDGFEVKVLNGAIETITRNKPAINIEMKKEKRPSICIEIRKILSSLSYYPRRRTRSDIIWTK